uniref:PsbP C-terminal domain-containing protein n=1 Tax=Kalanchoe fedtschenkoi TaxID=63787 RepID=A0A7N0V4V5_KALFE
MGSTAFTTTTRSCFCYTSFKNCCRAEYHLPALPFKSTLAWTQASNLSSIKPMMCSRGGGNSTVAEDDDMPPAQWSIGRRSVLAFGSCLLSSAAVSSFPGGGFAVVKQGLLAGRIPGLSEPDAQGWRTYRRPDEKSGGHGVGWSPIIPYTFSVPSGWEEVPVSIADLGGTEIDLRFANPKQGRLSVIVAPVLRFADNLGDDVAIEKIGKPDKVIAAFGPEVIGENVEGKVVSTDVVEHEGRTYYQFELEPPHFFITATAAGNRLYLFSITANGLQWKKNYKDLKRIATSFRVV